MDLRHSMLYRGWGAAIRFHRRLEGERNRPLHVFRSIGPER